MTSVEAGRPRPRPRHPASSSCRPMTSSLRGPFTWRRLPGPTSCGLSASGSRLRRSARFEQGVASSPGRISQGRRISFKSAIQADSDNASAALAYLAATFAAAGHDAEAASAWQTALIDGSDLPQIYVWLGDALMRTRNLARGARDPRGRSQEMAVRPPFHQAAGGPLRDLRSRPGGAAHARALSRRTPLMTWRRITSASSGRTTCICPGSSLIREPTT